MLEIPEQPLMPKATPTKGPLKFRLVNREQTVIAPIYVEELIPADHKARAIWELIGRMDLSRFSEALRTSAGDVGRPAWDPHLLVSLWVYAYSEGISSAREIERIMEWEPAMQWLSGLEKINHHTLSDFRVEHKTALDELFAELLAILDQAGMVSLEQVMHDGTKIRALAGADTFRRKESLQEKLQKAREAVKQMGDPTAAAPGRDRKQAARERALRERCERLEAAAKELEALQSEKRKQEEKAQARVSEQEPEARLMKHGDHAFSPSYNAQITTEASHKIIVGAHLSQSSSDAKSLPPALKEIEENLGALPKQVVVDGGFTNRDSILHCAEKKIDLVGALPDPRERSEAAMKAAGIHPNFAPGQFRILDQGAGLECPAGCLLEPLRLTRKRGDLYQQYRAEGVDCLACDYREQCCPRNAEKGRMVSMASRSRRR